MLKLDIDRCIAEANSVADHVWAMLLIVIGAVLVACHHKDVGELIVGGGLALFKTQSK